MILGGCYMADRQAMYVVVGCGSLGERSGWAEVDKGRC